MRKLSKQLKNKTYDKSVHPKINMEELIYPVFIKGGEGVKEEIRSMPGICIMSEDMLLEELKNPRYKLKFDGTGRIVGRWPEL